MHGIAHDLFHIGVPAGEKVIRTLAVYLAVLVLLRIFGKRQLAQLNALDLVVLLLLSNVLQNAIIGNDNSLVGGVLGGFTLLLANYLLIRITYRHRGLFELVQGHPTDLVRRGHRQDHELRKQLITPAELDSVLRREGIDAGVKGVEKATLEPEGTITPVTKHGPTIADVLERLDRIESRLERS